MEKNKIPIWENTKFYSLKQPSLLGTILAISNRDFQIRVWAKALGPEMDWYTECMVGFDGDIEVFKSFLRDRVFVLTKKQVKAVLRLHAMCLHFDRHLDAKEIPQDWYESEMYIIDHPYFEKIRKQAQYALSLFRIKEDQMQAE